MHFKTPCVRDLAWAIGSSPLQQRSGLAVHWPDANWCAQQLALASDWLNELDANPQALINHLSASNDRRLGRRFEDLLAFWLSWPDNPNYSLLLRNHALRNAERTLGEIDFLVRNKQTNAIEHWEVAVKFYLGTPQGLWLGPGQRDRLDLKLLRLDQHQLKLTQLVAGQDWLAQLDLPQPIDIKPVCLVKGRLFYPQHFDLAPPPSASPTHLRATWFTHDEFLAQANHHQLRWQLLDKTYWLAQLHHDTAKLLYEHTLSADELVSCLSAEDPRYAIAIIGLTPANEAIRAFLAPNTWPSGQSQVLS
ncbi:MAG: DUF1853 family protein [Moraxellaceae bacterium]|nr:DUF1853 family protein [Moraxellaceae bacterium]